MKLPKGFGGQGFGGMMQQMQSAMARAQELETELQSERLETTTGPVTVVFDGTGNLVSMKIDPTVVDPNDVEMLEDMIVSAFRAGFEKATALRAERTNSILPNIPGLPRF